ncbi:hypothetical protein A2Z22_01255 [Candidatus Woesebacteria bacterium RBG_16_34_12]|uniref:Aminoglycoside phosphotransferase domain-containing protein n=1 Tax=Candidatus Woesebacteria bacterium RBG_16_34_12 TaxID=1802480 RepID=A0A1F7X8U9_9BACT|nr:MAG: hypothetical protein A2Z22_01255 [Candidatus Woesebacteria bacterium RBG_16_34_12]
MKSEDMKDDNYQIYLQQKHAKFSVSSEVVENAVVEATGSELKSSKRIIAGEANEVYDVKTEGGNLIVRISRSGENRFIPEKWAIEKARRVGVPAPEILLITKGKDKGKRIYVSVETKLPGVPLGQLIETKSLSEAETKRIVQNAGGMLAKIHSIIPKKFGRLHRTGIGKYNTWVSYMLSPLEEEQIEALKKSAVKNSITTGDIDKALQILKDQRSVYQGITPHLLHGDFGPKHILVESGKISGILDFENVKSGDPIYDFSWWSYFSKNRPPIEWLKEGYEKVASLPYDFDLKLRLGRLRLGADFIWYYDMEDHDVGLTVAKENLQEDLAWFSQ